MADLSVSIDGATWSPIGVHQPGPDPGPDPGPGVPNLPVPAWNLASPMGGYQPWIDAREGQTLPDPFVLGGQAGCRVPLSQLTTITEEDLESELAANKYASKFRIVGRIRPESAAWHNALIEDFWIDGIASTSGYMMQPFQRAGSVIPPNYAAWPHFRYGTLRGWGARPEYDGGEISTPSTMYGQYVRLEAINFYGTKNGMQPTGDFHMWASWGHGNHWVPGAHNGIVQRRQGGGFWLVQDCRFEGFRDYHSTGPGGGDISGACWQTGSLLSAIEFGLMDNCFFDGGQVSLRGADLAGDGGWASGASDPDGYVKDYGFYVFYKPFLGRNFGSSPIASVGTESQAIDPRWHDTRTPVGA